MAGSDEVTRLADQREAGKLFDDTSCLVFPASVVQVRFLEQQNKMLETKLELLQVQGVGRSNVEPMFEAYMAGLRRQMDLVNNDKTKLDGELRNMQGLVEDYKHK